MPFAVRLHLAVSLIGLLSLGVYLSPAMDLEADLAGILLGINMAIVAIGMATGWHTREAAWLLIALGPLGMIEFGVSPVLQRLDVLGLAVFVLCTGPGRWSADMELGRRARAEPRRPGPRRVGAARGRGGGADRRRVRREAGEHGARARVPPGPSRAQRRAASSGWAGATSQFIRVAGAIEVLFGLLLISGALPQAVVVIAGVPFNASLWFFGVNELLGHLPVYAAMLVLLVYGSDRELRARVPALWPWTGRAAARGS